ncbi:MAG: MBL fold metallo-hydrolase [Thermoplasmatales archaeon]|nr:MBL fold metallo-hydrolase [Thermoplasmatales archaeon]
MTQDLATRTFTTKVPDKPGAFMVATKIIMRHGGNITRVSYNKAVDLHTIFIEVTAPEAALDAIGDQLSTVGYLAEALPESRVVVVNIKIKDEPGGLYPVLKILDKYDVNISYLNSNADNGDYQDFKMGLFMENPDIVKLVLDDVSELYPIDVINYVGDESALDNTVFYIRLGNEIRGMFDLGEEKAMEFIQESNRILQMLQDRGSDPREVFDGVRNLAKFVARYRKENFFADVSHVELTAETTLHVIEPPCGSNTYVLEHGDGLLFVDSGFAVYANEMRVLLNSMFPNFDSRKKTMTVTHADVDHCGLLSVFKDARILLNGRSAESLAKQHSMEHDMREETGIHLGYSRLSRIITDYVPPDPSRFEIIGSAPDPENDGFTHVGTIDFGGLELKVYEGPGGHLPGECAIICDEAKIAFTGDILVNLKGLSPERREFVSIAPFLMTNVDVDPELAKRGRAALRGLLASKGGDFLVCGGHGPTMRL